jgi:hypothetical protein
MPSETLVLYFSKRPVEPDPLQTSKFAVRVELPALSSVRAAALCPLATMLLAKVLAGAELGVFLRPL